MDWMMGVERGKAMMGELYQSLGGLGVRPKGNKHRRGIG